MFQRFFNNSASKQSKKQNFFGETSSLFFKGRGRSKINTKADIHSLRAIANKLELQFENDLFELLEPGDIIEVYNKDSMQVYRNLTFHKVYSYDLIDLFIKPRTELFKRDDFFEKQIKNVESEVFKSSTCKPFCLKNIKPHLLKERSSAELRSVFIRLKFMYPLINKISGVNYVVLVSRTD